jgi:hypothetical protein
MREDIQLPEPDFLTIDQTANLLKLPVERVAWFIDSEYLNAYVFTLIQGCIDKDNNSNYYRLKGPLRWSENKFWEGKMLFYEGLDVLDNAGDIVEVVSKPYGCFYKDIRISSKELKTLPTRGGKRSRTKESRQAPAENPKSINSLLKIVRIMAVNKYKYDPTAERSIVPTIIVKQAAAMDITISEKTVREWLQKTEDIYKAKNER